LAPGDVVSRVWELAEQVASELGLELVEVESGGGKKRQLFRLFVDKAGGVALKDCVEMSRRLSEWMEEEGAVDASHVLEVSSPGLERPLRKASDFERFAGRKISLSLRKRDEETGRQKFSGILQGVEDGSVALRLDEGGERSFPLDGISKARLKVDWDSVFQDKG
jgi:ribosome maturation factor RimP